MPKKRFRRAAVIALVPLVLAGCWDFVDINQKNIITTAILDKKDGAYMSYLEIANTDASGPDAKKDAGSDEYVFLKGNGKTYPEMRDALERSTDQPIYLNAMQALVLTENLTNDDIAEYLNRLRSDVNYRKRVIIVTTSEEPEALFKISKNGESIGFYIQDMFNHLNAQNQIFVRETSHFIESLSSSYSSFLIPSIGINDNALELRGYSVVDDTKTVGLIPIQQADGIVLLKDSKAHFQYFISAQETAYTVNTHLTKKKVTPYYQDGQAGFNLDFKFSAEVAYSTGSVDDGIKQELRSSLEQLLYDKITDAVWVSQKQYGCDYLTLHDTFHAIYPETYHNLSWAEVYPDAQINVTVSADLDTQPLMDYEAYRKE